MTAKIPGALNINAANLTGDMIIEVGTTGPRTAQTTLANLGQFFGIDPDIVNTPLTTAGAGTLTATALTGGLITRTGPNAAFTDTTDTAALLLAAFGSDQPVGNAQLVYIKNTTAFTETLAGGAGVTLSGQTIIPPNSVGLFLLTYSAATPVFTMRGVSVVPMTTPVLEIVTNLTTVGAGTVLAASIAGGIVNRTGPTTAVADTTDTAALIIAAVPNANVGQSWEFTEYNNSLGAITLTGGVGVNAAAAISIIPGNTWARYLVTIATPTTVTFTPIASGPCVALPVSKFTTGTAATFNAGDISGAAFTNYQNTAANATLTTRTAAQMFADIPNCQIGYTYQLAIRNTNATGATITAADGSVTLTGTMTIAQNVTRLFSVTFTSVTAVTITSMGISAAAA